MTFMVGDLGMVFIDKDWAGPNIDKGRVAMEVVLLTLGSVAAAVKTRRNNRRLRASQLPKGQGQTQAEQIGLEG